ncbi:EAL domain-containing protein, partial [Escherichia coli]|uniref:EAL domain-containing protein n=1 Tax=Escherichia coli TaxID=562 RepID=UPI000F0B8FBB
HNPLRGRLTRNLIYSTKPLARYNRIPVIAEGVESEDVARELIKLGCVQAQGYLYQKPMPFSAWDKSGKLVKE